jgi:hypothetical protein
MATNYEEGVTKLFNLTLKAKNFVERRLSFSNSISDMTYLSECEEVSKEVAKIVKVISQLDYTLTRLKAMQEEIQAEAAAEERKYNKADLSV